MCIVWVVAADAALPRHDPPPSFPRSQGGGVSSSKTHHPLQPKGMGGARAIAVGAIDPAPGIGTKAVRPASLHACRPHFKLEAHPDSAGLRLALEELRFFSRSLRILGVYPAHPTRFQSRLGSGGPDLRPLSPSAVIVGL